MKMFKALESGEGAGAVVARKNTPGRVYQYSIQDASAP